MAKETKRFWTQDSETGDVEEEVRRKVETYESGKDYRDEDLIEQFQEENGCSCELTGRVLGDADKGWLEWATSGKIFGRDATLYYLTTPEDEDEVANCNYDWGIIDWDNRVSKLVFED